MRKAIAIVISAAAAAVTAAAAVLCIGVHAYLEKVPVVTAKQGVSAAAGGKLSITDLADVEKAVDAYIYAGSSTPMMVSDDGHILFVGDKPGAYEVFVEAVGANSERRSASVMVKVLHSFPRRESNFVSEITAK